MNRRPFLLLALLAPLLAPAAACACTICVVRAGDRVYFGNNEDWSDPDTKLWFLAPEPGHHGRVYLGFKNGWAQGGMNDQGLCFDWIATGPTPWKADPAKPTYGGNLSEKILEECSTLEEALAVYDRYNEPGFARALTVIADRTGASAVVGFEDGRLKVTRGDGRLLATGFAGDAARQKLSALEAPTADAVAAALGECLQDGQTPTRYTNVFDPASGGILIHQFRDHRPVARLSLRDELRKGSHYYDLPKIAAQLKLPSRTDNKTRPAVTLPASSLARCVGRYELAPNLRMDITLRDGRLSCRVNDEPPCELLAASETTYFVRFIDSDVQFPGGAAKAERAHVHTPDKEYDARRIE
jgi:hypothetical protein